MSDGAYSTNAFVTPEQIRREIHFEHTQLGQRMGWYASSQAFMCTAYVLSINGMQEAQSPSAHMALFIASRYLPFMGLVLSLLAEMAILMAVVRLHGWWDKQADWNWAHFSKPRQYAALAYPVATPAFVGVFWLLLLLCVPIWTRQ